MTAYIGDREINSLESLYEELRKIKSKVIQIETSISKNPEEILFRYNISYFYMGKGISVIKNTDEISSTEERNLASHLYELGVPDISQDTYVEYSDSVLSYMIDKMEESSKEQLIIMGENIRYSNKSTSNKKNLNSNRWSNLDSNVMVIVQKLPILVEDISNAKKERFEKISKQLKELNVITADNKINLAI